MGKLRTLTAKSLKEPWEVVCDGVVIARLVPSVPSSQIKQSERAPDVPTSPPPPPPDTNPGVQLREFGWLSKQRQASKKGFNA